MKIHKFLGLSMHWLGIQYLFSVWPSQLFQGNKKRRIPSNCFKLRPELKIRKKWFYIRALRRIASLRPKLKALSLPLSLSLSVLTLVRIAMLSLSPSSPLSHSFSFSFFLFLSHTHTHTHSHRRSQFTRL